MPKMVELKDEALTSLTLLIYIFGQDGYTQFRSFYKEHYRIYNYKSLTTVKLITIVISNLKGLKYLTLS